jgi:CheY-like chemotaxis protein
MPGGGRVTVETRTVDLTSDYAASHFSVQPGRYVCLAVTDTGQGMSEGTRARLFEPFFTTKEVGKGTGLGLSTIYGIVKQYGGDIWEYTEPGRGTTFKVYLPAAAGTPDAPATALDRSILRGSETILLVEDDTVLRELTGRLLQDLGYKVLAAASGEEAIRISSLHAGKVHLLLTDVVMPNVNGPDVSEWLKRLKRQTRVLYMSGYPAETVVQHGVLDPDASFLEKPFTPETLARKVREVLDATGAASPVFPG